MAPRDPRSVIQLNPSGARFDLPRVGKPAARTIPMPTGDAASLAGIGDAVQKVADFFEAREMKAERLEAASWRAEDRVAWTRRLEELKETAEPGAPDFTARALEAFDAFAGERLKGARSAAMREEVELGLLNLRTQIAGEAVSYESGARVAKRRTDLDQVVRLNSHVVAQDAGQFDRLLRETESAILSAGLPAEMAQAEIRQARTGFAEAALMGLTQRSPAAAMAAIGSGAYAPYMDADRLLRLHQHARYEDERRRAEARRADDERRAKARVDLEPRIKDALAAYQRGDQSVAPPDDRAILHAYGAEKGARIVAELGEWRELGRDLAGVAMLRPEETAALLERWKPAGDNFAEEAERYDRLARAVDLDQRARATDPAQYVLDRSAQLRDLLGRAIQDPQAGADAANLSLSLQEQAGVPAHERRVLPKAMAEATIRNLTAGPAEMRADRLQMAAEGYGSLWPTVYGQLVKEGLPADMEVLATVEHPVGRVELAQAQSVGKDKLKTAAGADAKVIDRAVRDALEPFRRSLALAPDGAAKAALWEEQAALLAYRKAQYMPAADAAAAAVEEMTLHRYDLVEQAGGLLTARAPKGEGRRVADFAARVLSDLTPDALADIGGGGDLTAADRQAIILDAAMDGVWVTNESDDGWVRLDIRRQPVWLRDGRRLEFRFRDVTDRPPAAAPADPAQPGRAAVIRGELEAIGRMMEVRP